MLAALTDLVANLYIPFEWVICFCLLLGGIIFFAADFKKGTMLYMIAFGCCFMWFYTASYNWVIPLSLMFISFVVMCLGLYGQAKAISQRGFV